MWISVAIHKTPVGFHQLWSTFEPDFSGSVRTALPALVLPAEVQTTGVELSGQSFFSLGSRGNRTRVKCSGQKDFVQRDWTCLLTWGETSWAFLSLLQGAGSQESLSTRHCWVCTQPNPLSPSSKGGWAAPPGTAKVWKVSFLREDTSPAWALLPSSAQGSSLGQQGLLDALRHGS